MSNVQVRGVPESVVDALKSAAAAHGQSLQQYLLDLFTEQANAERTSAIMAEAAADARGSGSRRFHADDLVRETREERDRELFGRNDA